MSFEELKIQKFLNLSQLEWSAPVLFANFGDGYGAGALSGSPAGLHRWSLSAEVLPDLEEFSIDYVLDDEPETDTRFEYLFSFIKRHTALGVKPFKIKDPRTGKFYLASFDGAQFGFEALTAKLFRGGIVLNQRSAKNVLFNADRSLFAAPDNFKVKPLTSEAVTFSWKVAKNDDQVGYDLWVDGDPPYELGLIQPEQGIITHPFGPLVTGSTHTAKIRSRRVRNGVVERSDYSELITFVVQNVGGNTPVNITPPSPTNPTTDDVNNAFGFTLATGYQLADHEYSIDGGGSWANVLTNPIGVGNAAYAVGQVRVRVKAATGRNASASLSNTVAFTAATAGYSIDDFDVLRNYNGETIQSDGLLNFAATLISDVTVGGNAPTLALGGYTLSNYTPLRTLHEATANDDNLLFEKIGNFVATMAADLKTVGNLSAFTVSYSTPHRALNGGKTNPALSSDDERLLAVILTFADDFGATNAAP